MLARILNWLNQESNPFVQLSIKLSLYRKKYILILSLWYYGSVFLGKSKYIIYFVFKLNIYKKIDNQNFKSWIELCSKHQIFKYFWSERE